MKLTNSKIYPRPMLKDINDGYKSNIEAFFGIEQYVDKSILKYDVKISSNEIIDLVSKGKAGVYLHLYSLNEMYREVFDISENLYSSISLKKEKVYNTFEISTIICAKEDLVISGENELLDPDDVKYQVNKGMIIGFAETQICDVDLSHQNLDDLVSVKSTTEKEAINKIEINDDNIIFYMEENEYQAFHELYNSTENVGKSISYVIHSSIYQRLLLEYIENRNNEEELEELIEYKWYKLLEQKFSEKYPNMTLEEIEYSDIPKYALELSDLSFTDVQKAVEESNE